MPLGLVTEWLVPSRLIEMVTRYHVLSGIGQVVNNPNLVYYAYNICNSKVKAQKYVQTWP